MTIWVRFEDVIKLLIEYDDLLPDFPLMKRKLIKPTHGNCCTCQKCGHGHDECVCSHNEIVDIIDKWEKRLSFTSCFH